MTKTTEIKRGPAGPPGVQGRDGVHGRDGAPGKDGKDAPLVSQVASYVAMALAFIAMLIAVSGCSTTQVPVADQCDVIGCDHKAEYETIYIDGMVHHGTAYLCRVHLHNRPSKDEIRFWDNLVVTENDQ